MDEKEEVILQLEGPLVPLLHKLLKEGEYLYACMYVCMYVMMCVYVSMEISVFTYACKYLCASARMLV